MYINREENPTNGGESNNRDSRPREFFETFRKFMKENWDGRMPYKMVVQMHYRTKPVFREWGIAENPEGSKGSTQLPSVMTVKSAVKVPKDATTAVATNNQKVKKTPEVFLVDAIIKDDINAADSLLKKGASPYAIVNGEPLIEFAKRLGRWEIVKLIGKRMMGS